jgi:predicted nuclease with TOPRIM domain
MSTATLERLPNTVTKCHAEIVKLRALAGDPDANAERIVELEAELSEAREELEETEKENAELEARVEELEKNEHLDAVVAIDKFLDECERVGPLRYDVPQTDRAMRAIIGLHDSVGRTP